MAKYNRSAKAPAVGVYTAKAPKSPIGTKKSGARAKTYEGHEGYAHRDKSELFLLAAGSFAGEDAFYEKANVRTQRLVDLVRTVAVKDPDWTGEFLTWLRSEGNIRTASVVGAVEAADALVKAGIPGGRGIVASVLQRADEPGEVMAYWLATRGRKVLMPKAIKRGIADAAERLYTEFSFLKYDSSRSSVRFGDVIEMTRPDPEGAGTWKSELFRYAIEQRHGRGTEPGKNLPMIRNQRELRRQFETDPTVLLNPENLQAAGMTWEDVLSLAGSKLDKDKLWKAILPSLGYMALLRNLRNLDQAGVSDAIVAQAIARLQDPEQVAKSRQLPFRFYSAYKAVEEDRSLRWSHALDVALNHSLRNIPALGGRTLILIDTSGSMSWTHISKDSQRTCEEIAGLFGIALSMKGEADVYGWADSPFYFPTKGTSVLRNLEVFQKLNDSTGSGTNLEAAIRGTYVPGKYDRMVVISDMQVRPYGRGVIPTDIPVYLFNLAGYKATVAPSTGNVYELGGLTDHTFKMITMLEAGKNGRWPWEMSDEDALLAKMDQPEEVVKTSLV